MKNVLNLNFLKELDYIESCILHEKILNIIISFYNDIKKEI